MATAISPLAFFSAGAAATTGAIVPKPSQTPPLPKPLIPVLQSNPSGPLSSLTAPISAIAVAAILSTTPPSLADAGGAFNVYYGTAASWKERLVSKVEKGTNGTDSEFYNPKKRKEKEYLTFLAGIRQLAPKDVILNNLALSDVNLQDQIASAEGFSAEEKKDENGQIYYVYEIDGAGTHSLISVTCAKNKLYAHFVNAPTPEWDRDQDMLRHVHESFKTVGSY
ncbi:Thylakoid lumenal 19 kDa protein, chloroplastic, partial [Cucurbita argyrosperma subsp. sororia]